MTVLVDFESGYCSLEDPKNRLFYFHCSNFIYHCQFEFPEHCFTPYHQGAAYHAGCYDYWNMWHSNHIIPLHNNYSHIPVHL